MFHPAESFSHSSYRHLPQFPCNQLLNSTNDESTPLKDTGFCTELKDRSILGNRPHIFHVTISFGIALCTSPLLGCQPGNYIGKTRREESVLRFNWNCSAFCKAEPTKNQQQQWGPQPPYQGQRGTNTHLRPQTSLSYCNTETFTLN